MSENEPKPSAQPPSEDAKSETAAARPARRWRRRLLVVLGVFFVLLIALRATMYWTLPIAISRAAAYYNLDATFEHSHIDLIGGDVGIWNLRVTPRGGGDPILVAGYVRGDLSTVALLAGHLKVMRAEVDNVNILLERTTDGSIPLLEELARVGPAEPAAPITHIDFTPPLTIHAIRMSKVSLRIRDAYVEPGLDVVLAMTMRLSDFGESDRPARFEVNAWADGLVDTLRIVSDAQGQGQNLAANLDVYFGGFHPRTLRAYLEPLGLRPVAESVSAAMSMTVAARPASNEAESQTRPTSRPATAPSPAPAAGAIAATIDVNNLKLNADGHDAASVDNVSVDVAELSPTTLRVGKVLFDTIRLRASRSAQGNFRAAGFEKIPPTAEILATTTRPVAPAPAGRPATANKPGPASTPFEMAFAEFAVRDVQADFHDDAVVPPVDMRLLVKNIDCRAAAGKSALDPEATLDIDGAISIPNVVQAITLDGAAQPFARTRTVGLALRAEGIKPDALRPYLEAAGARLMLNDATFTARLDASLAPAPAGENGMVANAKLSDIALADGRDLFTFHELSIKNASLDDAAGKYRVERVELSGPSLQIRRKADGAIETMGIHLSPTAPATAAAKTSPPTAPPAVNAPTAAPLSLPRVEIDQLTWKGIRLTVADETTGPKSTFVIGDAGLELSDLLVDLRKNADADSARKGKLKFWISAPELAEKLNIEGSLSPRAGALGADLQVSANGVDLTRLAPYLKRMNIEPLMKSGSFDAAIKADVSRDEGDQLRASLDLTNVKLADGSDELVRLASLHVGGVESSSKGLRVEKIEMRQPFAELTREADGSLVAAGVRIRPATQPSAPAAAPTSQPSAVATTQPVAPAPTPIALQGLVIEDAGLRWKDQAVSPPASIDATVNVRMDDIVSGRAAPPGKFSVELAAKNIVDKLKLDGMLDLTPGANAANVHVAGQGIRGGPLASYLPSGSKFELKNGTFRADLDAALKDHPKGGQAFALNIRDVDYRDGGPSLLGLKSLKVDAPRIDLANDVIALGEVSASGFELRAGRDAQSATRLLGLSIQLGAQPAAQHVAVKPLPTTAPAAPPTTAPASAAIDAEKEIARQVAEARRPLPLLTLDKLDLGASHIEWLDASHAGAKPLIVRDLKLKSLARIELGGPKAESLPPVKVQLNAAADPLAKQLVLRAEASPFATEPAANLDLNVWGISGKGLTDLRPDLASTIDGSKLTDGRLRADLQAHAKFSRRGSRDFDLSRGFDLDFAMKSFALTNGDGGAVLAGVESLQCDSLRVEPNNGRIHAKVLEITKPIATGSRQADGIHLLGLVIKPPPAPATQPATTVPTEPSSRPAASQPAPAVIANAQAPKSEIRVDRILVTGIDARFDDLSVTPPLNVPLNNLDVEVRDFTTLALSEPRPVRFSVVVGSGKVPLPKHVKGAGIAGAVSDLTNLVVGEKTEELTAATEVEDRELFSQITSAGSLVLYPVPVGYVKSSVSGLELAALSGEAQQQGINLAGGVFDSNVEAFFREDGSLDARCRFVFTDLSVAEPPDGPIVRHLHLPAPLDAVLAALRDADGSITIPLSVPVEKGKVNKDAVMTSAINAVGGVIATAIASAPVKLVGGVGDILGLGAGNEKDKKAEEQPIALSFGAGDASLSAQDRQALVAMIRLMRKDKTVELTARHELSAGDVEAAQLRANPSPDDALALARNLERRKAALHIARRELASRARAELASLPEDQTRATLNELRGIDRELAAAEDASDWLFDMLRPGAERQATRRTRAASLQIAQQRLSAVRESLTSSPDIPLVEERVRTANPQFDPTSDDAGGRVLVKVVKKKRE